MRFTPESQRRFATSKYATCETTSILVLGFGGARKRRSARQDFRRIRFLLHAQVNREGIDWTEHHRRPDRYGALRNTEEGFCSSWSFIAADVGPIKVTRRVRLALSVGGMSCVAPAMQAVATSVASRLFHPDGFANNPSNPQTPQNPTQFVCFSCCCSRIAIRAMKTTSTRAEVCVLGMPVFFKLLLQFQMVPTLKKKK